MYVYECIHKFQLNHLDILAVKTVVIHIERVATSAHDTAVQVRLKLQGVKALKVCKLLPFESATQHLNRMRLRSSELQVSPGPVLGGSSNSSAKFAAIHPDNFWGRNCSRGWLFRWAYSKLCSCRFDAPEAVKACGFRSITSRLGARIAP